MPSNIPAVRAKPTNCTGTRISLSICIKHKNDHAHEPHSSEAHSFVGAGLRYFADKGGHDFLVLGHRGYGCTSAAASSGNLSAIFSATARQAATSSSSLRRFTSAICASISATLSIVSEKMAPEP